MTRARPVHAACRAFSLVEIAVVVVIIGIVAAIAVPRMSGAAVRTKVASMRASLATLNRAAELYAAEHGGRCPACDTSGGVSTDSDGMVARLVQRTSESGALSGALGPYLLNVPLNPFNRLASVRIDGAPAGAGTHGWRYDSATRSFQADDSVAMATIGADSVAAAAMATSDLISGKELDADALKALDGVK